VGGLQLFVVPKPLLDSLFPDFSFKSCDFLYHCFTRKSCKYQDELIATEKEAKEKRIRIWSGQKTKKTYFLFEELNGVLEQRFNLSFEDKLVK